MDFNDLMATPISPSFLAQSAAPFHPELSLLADRSASANRAAGFTFDLDEMELLIPSSRFRYEADGDDAYRKPAVFFSYFRILIFFFC